MISPRYPVGQRSETVRRANLSAIVRELHARGPQSRSKLVARTGLTRSAIRGLIGEFAAAGIAVEHGQPRWNLPGRPSPLVRLVAGARRRPGPRDHRRLARPSRSSASAAMSSSIDPGRSAPRPRPRLDARRRPRGLADRVLVPSRSARVPFIGVGVAVAGIVRRTDGWVSMAPNLGWRDVPLGERARPGARDRPVPLEVANDADLGALAELRRGAAGAGSTIVLPVGRGRRRRRNHHRRPAAQRRRRIWRARSATCRSIRRGGPCRCGSIGLLGDGDRERGPPAPARASRPTAGAPSRGRPGRGDRRAIRLALAALEATGRWLGLGLAGLVNILNPGLVVFGGLSRPPPVHRAARPRRARPARAPAAARLVGLAPAALGGDAPLLGAAELAFEPLLADPARWLPRRDLLLERASA